jgi:hypothetical protein
MMLLFQNILPFTLLHLVVGSLSSTTAVTEDPIACKAVNVEEVILKCGDNSDCLDGDPYAQVDLKFDLYTCDNDDERRTVLRHRNEQQHQERQPFLLVACGAPGLKEDYSMFATEMVQKGYNVAVPEKIIYPIPANPSILLNAVTPADFRRVIDHVVVGTDVDAKDVFLLGHSFGGAQVMSALNEVCNSMFCAPLEFPPTNIYYVNNVTLPVAVRGGGTYGTPSIQMGGRIGAPGQPDPYLFNDGRPLFMFFGDGDINVINSCGTACDEKFNYLYTYDHMSADKYLIVGDDLDHDSIANRIIAVTSTFRNSTLPRDVQVKRVADGFDQWIQHVLYDVSDQEEDFCRVLEFLLETALARSGEGGICMFQVENPAENATSSGDVSVTLDDSDFTAQEDRAVSDQEEDFCQALE